MTLSQIIESIKPADKEIFEASKRKWLTVAKPLYSLGRLETLISQIAAITRDIDVKTDKKALVIMCADNGVVSEGVTQCGQGITAMVTGNFIKRKACVSIMAEYAGCDLFPVDIGVAEDVPGVSVSEKKIRYGTDNIANGPAMTREEAVRAVETGIETVRELKEKGYQLIATGEMGIGNTTTSSAVTTVLLDKSPEEVTGRGAGLSSEGLEKKIKTIKRAIEINKPDKNDIINVITRVGGLDLAGLCGVFLGGAAYHVPVIIDGFISAAAALCAKRLCPDTCDYMIPSHVSAEPAGKLVLEALDLMPYIDCGMFLGEGSGAVALMPIIDMASGVYRDMTTFDEWTEHEAYRELM
ncbi:MAG: nicotinate-nucleotide--dimethylbenzimidazole phosphoribosyltransferase [Oscillospiraceae bacterium]|nr:nicotinate-nucleotide--dimethylbenzimidazole phosphoribosyltransferase [Oscillospiraceae bacterium]